MRELAPSRSLAPSPDHGPPRPLRIDALIISLKPHSIAVSVDGTRVVSWDRGGRLYSVYDDGVTWRRGLSGQVIEKRRVGEERERVLLADDAAEARRRLGGRCRAGHARADGQRLVAVDERRRSVVAQESRALLALRVAVRRAPPRAPTRIGSSLVFGRVGILPPDQYLSLVVQATEGCSFNTCTFCDLYHEGIRVKTRRSSASTLRGVLGYLGASVGLRPAASSSARRTRWRCRWRACCRSSRRCSRSWMPRAAASSRSWTASPAPEEDRGRVPAAEPPRPAPRLRRPRVRPRSAAGVRAQARHRRGRHRDGPRRSRRRACRPA